MPAVINTAASFWQQFGQAVDTDTATPLPCTIVRVMTNGSRVNVAVEQPAQTHQTPQGAWVENNVPFVETGVATPTEGYFVTATDYQSPAEVAAAAAAAAAAAQSGGSGDQSGSAGN